MPSGKYYRTQAQLFARLAVITSDPFIAARYNQMALEHLAKAEEVEPAAGQQPHELLGDDSTDLDRD